MYGLVKGATGTKGGGKVDERLRRGGPRQTFQPLFRDCFRFKEAVLVDDVFAKEREDNIVYFGGERVPCCHNGKVDD